MASRSAPVSRLSNVTQQLFSGLRGRMVLAACAGEAQAREKASLGHGVFTYYVLRHWRDLEGYFVACRYGSPARAGVPVYAPPGLRDHAYFDLEPTFAWHEVADGDRVAVDGLDLKIAVALAS